MFNSKTISTIAALVALSSPAAASAMQITDQGAAQPVPVTPPQQRQLDRLQNNVSQLYASQGGWHLTSSSAKAAGSPSQGFQWDDAGIGAVGAVGLLGAGAAAAGATRRRRSYRSALG